MVDRILNAVDICEDLLGRPGTGIEIFEVFDERGMADYTMPLNDAKQRSKFNRRDRRGGPGSENVEHGRKNAKNK